MKNISILVTLIVLQLPLYTHSQTINRGNHIGIASWEVSFPGSNDYISESSFSGWRLEYRYIVKPRLSFGVAISVNSYDEYVNTATYKPEGGTVAITSDMVRQVYTVPILLTTHYYPEVKSKLFRPFGGLGIGAQYAEYNSYFNVYGIGSSSWGFAVQPEIGTFLRFSETTSAMLSFGYSIATNKNEVFDLSNFNQFKINLGLALSKF